MAKGALFTSPTAGGVALLVLVGGVAALPFFRDPSVVVALEGAGATSAAQAVVAPGPGPAEARPRPASSDSASAMAVEPAPPRSTAPAAVLDRAASAADLRKLAAEYPKDPRVLTKLARALSTTPDGLHEACITLRELFLISPASMKEPEVQTVLKRGASGQPATSDLALDIMATSMGAIGPDLLWEISAAKSVSKTVRDKANGLLQRDDVRKRATPALQVAVDLRDLPPCDRKRLFADAEKHGDSRSLPALTPLQATRGCGVFRLGDCYSSCLGGRAELNKAIQAIRQRGQ